MHDTSDELEGLGFVYHYFLPLYHITKHQALIIHEAPSDLSCARDQPVLNTGGKSEERRLTECP